MGPLPLRSVCLPAIWGPPQISFFTKYMGPPPSDYFLRFLYVAPFRLVSSLTIWGPSDQFLCILFGGPPQISFFSYYMGPLRSAFLHTIYGAPSDQSLRILYGGGGPQISFFAYYMGAPEISFFAYYMGAP